ncbi:hypothetical protein [Paenibacillus kobensis]|uniref:hypothetical protein n=1 Tax=Paenibacillus kobensis TaxID=59841 RepID=UPI000FDCAA4E|nr:hypothetical protein [Paenibacillus kobensis]
MTQVSVTVKNHNAPIIIYFSLDWDGGGHEETNRYYENQSKTLTADVPEGSNVTVTIYKMIEPLPVSWGDLFEQSYSLSSLPSCFEVTGLGDVSTC